MSAAVSAGRRVCTSEKSYDRSDFQLPLPARQSVAAAGIIVGAGEYTTGLGLTVLVLLVLIKEKVLVLSRFGPGFKRRRKGDSPDQQER